MKSVTATEVYNLIVRLYSDQLAARGLNDHQLPDDFDLLSEGIIDSLGIIELIAAMETDLGVEVDFEDLDPEELTIVGPLCNYVAQQSAGN